MKAEKTYDKYWESGLHKTGEWAPDYFKVHLGKLDGLDKVLDYGCGMGYAYQRQLSSVVKEYWGADVSDVAVSDAAKKGFHTLKIRENSTVDVPSEFFDGVVCSEVLEHLYDPLAAGKELYRLLKPGGIAVITVPHFGYFPWRLRALLVADVWSEPESAENPFKGVHIRYFSIRSLRALAKLSGFRSYNVYPFDKCNIWHMAHVAGPLSKIFHAANKHLPVWTRMGFLDNLFPQIFAQRIRLVAVK